MKERGILFSAPMVRALLAGTKTQTRRIVKLREFQPSTTKGYDWTFRDRRALWNDYRNDHITEVCPQGMIGDRLWVRETWQNVDGAIRFRADVADPIALITGIGGRGWKPGIHLRRVDSRTTLDVVGVRVERLQAITEDDARAEGVVPFFERFPQIGRDQRLTTGELARDCPYRASYACLWDEINGDTALWKSNPWVWVVEFRETP